MALEFVARLLAKRKGEFGLCDHLGRFVASGHWVRHKTLRCQDGLPCCPLAVADYDLTGVLPLGNTSPFLTLGADRATTNMAVRVADGMTPQSDEEAALQAALLELVS